MRKWRAIFCATLILTSLAVAQQQTGKAAQSAPSGVTAEAKLKDLLESKVRAEWDAFKNRDKKAYGGLLADDFVAVESDGDGARNKIHAVNEIDNSTVRGYSLFAFKLIPLASDAAIVTYEISMEFSPKAQVRFLRVWASELWLKRDGEWKARYYQETKVK